MRWTSPLLMAALLAGCAADGVPVPTESARQQMQARETRVLSHESWALRGRIAVSDGRDGGSARVNWEADGDRYELWIYAPLAQGTWRLDGDRSGAVLKGPKGTFRGEDAASLLAEHMGWHLPVEAMRHWARGLRAPQGPAQTEFDDHGRLQSLQQAGWTVTYTDWADYREFAMPRRIEAESPPYTVKLVIQDWALREHRQARLSHAGF